MEGKRFIRIHHLPWSRGGTVDDRVLSGTSHFNGRDVVMTTLFDGENITMMRDSIYARSPDADMRHPSRSFIMRTWSAIRKDIPVGWRVVGEHMYTTHSIYYDYLPAYFLGIAIITDQDWFLPWDDTLEWFELLNIEPVYDTWDGIYDEGVVKMGNLVNTQYTADLGEGEGYVIRVKAAFHESMAAWRIAKYVRPHQVTSTRQWRPTVNKLRLDVE